jgi:hypothetical protein
MLPQIPARKSTNRAGIPQLQPKSHPQKIHWPPSAPATNDGSEVLRIALGTEADNNGHSSGGLMFRSAVLQQDPQGATT